MSGPRKRKRPGNHHPRTLDVVAIEALADEALASGTYAVGEGCIVVSDVQVVEFAAQGHPLPDTLRLRRPDGRSVYVFRDVVQVLA